MDKLWGGSEVFDLRKESVLSEHLLRVSYGPKQRKIKFASGRLSVGELDRTTSKDLSKSARTD